MQQTLNAGSLVEVMRQASLISEQDYTDIVAEIKQTGVSEVAVLSKHGVPFQHPRTRYKKCRMRHILHSIGRYCS